MLLCGYLRLVQRTAKDSACRSVSVLSLTWQSTLNVCEEHFSYQLLFLLLGIEQVAMLLSLLSKNDIPTAGLPTRKIRKVTEINKCSLPLYVIPSRNTEIRSFLMQVRYWIILWHVLSFDYELYPSVFSADIVCPSGYNFQYIYSWIYIMSILRLIF